MATMTRDTYDLFKPRERGRFGENEELPGNDSVRSDLIDLDLVRHHETEKALLVSRDGMEANAVWLAKSACEVAFNGIVWGMLRNGRPLRMRALTVTLPARVAIEKGLR
jgi:hypothetical protein